MLSSLSLPLTQIKTHLNFSSLGFVLIETKERASFTSFISIEQREAGNEGSVFNCEEEKKVKAKERKHAFTLFACLSSLFLHFFYLVAGGLEVMLKSEE